MPLIPPGRLDAIEKMILAAEAPADFVPALAKEWGRSQRQVWKYVKRVRERLAERARAVDPEADRETVRAMALETFRAAREGGEDGPDTKGMVAAAKLFGEITGAIGPKRVEITGKGGGAIETKDTSPDGLATRLAAVIARVTGGAAGGPTAGGVPPAEPEGPGGGQ